MTEEFDKLGCKAGESEFIFSTASAIKLKTLKNVFWVFKLWLNLDNKIVKQ